MISRVITVVCSIALLFCLGAGSHASAQIGHTIRNGGGGAELKFASIWRSLGAQLAGCIHPADPCGLPSATRNLVSSLVKLKAECFALVGFESLSGSQMSRGACGETLTVNANLLYRGETAISESEMRALALSILQQRACEGNLISTDFSSVVAAAASLRYFHALELGGSSYFVKNQRLSSGDNASVRVNALEIDLNALLRSNYPHLPEKFNFGEFVAFVREVKLDIRGEIPLASGKISRFFISLEPSLDIATAFVYLQ